MIRETHEDFLSIIKSYSPDPNQPIAVVRKDFSAFFENFQHGERPLVEPVEIHKDLKGFWCSVPESLPDRTILFFHGGGFTVGSTQDHLGLIARIAHAARARVFSVDYRLAPEHVYPAAVEDALAAYRYLILHNHLPHHIIPVGISTGGTLALGLVLSLSGHKLPLPPATICMSPVVDMLFGGASMVANRDKDWITPARLNALRTVYLAGQDPNDPTASPIHANLSRLPRLYIQVGTHELLFDDISAFVKKAKWAGVVVRFEIWEGMFHYWQMFGEHVPEGHEALEHIGAFVNEVLAR
ncbi:MAG: alpha/beta hydrolase [Methanoregula sp.]|nr:alpha/beta hydrolase [Methanoregula sp.]